LTLPTSIILPQYRGSEDVAQVVKYQKELVYSLQRMYENVVQNVNGDIRQFTPQVFGATTAGAGTYSSQVGWYLRQGIMVDLWFDVTWTAHTGNGNLYLQLPYKTFNASTTAIPFVGVLQPDSVTFATGTAAVINAFPDSFRGDIWSYGSGIPSANVALAGTGQLRGHIRYVGTEFDRAT